MVVWLAAWDHRLIAFSDSDYPLPRFGQGAFRLAVEQIYKVGILSLPRLIELTRISHRRRPA